MEKMTISGRVLDTEGKVIKGAVVDVWHADSAGRYDLQPDSGVEGEMDYRAKLVTDEQGHYAFRSVMPCAYPIPDDGPGGELLRLMGTHNYRPAHIHFLIIAPGYLPLITHIFPEGTEYLDNDVVFGTKASLVKKFEKREPEEWSNG